MKTRVLLIAGAVAGALASPAVLAEGAGAATQLRSSDFNRFDSDRDGQVSRSEWNRAGAAAASGSSAASGASAARGSAAAPGLVIVTVTPVETRMMGEQRREALFRAVDANGDGAISQAEAGINTELVGAFRTLDGDGNGRIERQEFARVHVDDGSQAGQASTSSSRAPIPSSRIEEASKYGASAPAPGAAAGATGGTSSGAAAGGTRQGTSTVPSNVPTPSRY